MAVSLEDLYRRLQKMKEEANEIEHILVERLRAEKQTSEEEAKLPNRTTNPSEVHACVTDEDLADARITNLFEVKEKYYLIPKKAGVKSPPEL